MADGRPSPAELRARRPQLSAGAAALPADERAAALELLAGRGVPMVHVDVMDEEFAGRAVGSADLVADLRTPLLKDVHLMVAEPRPQIARYVAAGADAITVHVEAADPVGALEEIGSLGGPGPVLRGIAAWPTTPLADLIPLIGLADLVLVLGVSLDDRGSGPFEVGLQRMRELSAGGRRPLLSFDGGVTPDNAGLVAAAGCDLVVSGSGIFAADDPVAALDRTLAALDSVGAARSR